MIFTLIKVNLRALFAGLSKGGRRAKKKKTAGRKAVPAILIALLVLYIVGALMFSMGAMFYGICAPLFEAGVGWFYFALAGMVVFAIGFIGGIFMVQTQIFGARDNELLLSMPIKPSAILAGRLSALVIIEYLFEAVILIPVFAVLLMTGYISHLPAAGVVFFFASAVFLPLFALALGCFAGWIIALISSRMRRKNIAILIFSIAFLVAYFWLYSRMMNNINMLVENGAEIADAVRRAVFPAYHLGVAIADGSAVSFLLFAACAIIPFVIMCVVLSLSFVKLTTGGRVAKKVEYHEKTLRVSSSRAALLKRELLHYWSSPNFIMNSSLGAIMTLVIAVILIVRRGVITGMFDQINAVMPGIDTGYAGAIILSALAMMNFISAPTISLEGKNLWIVKSLPVKPLGILLSKVSLHLTIGGVPALIAGVACVIALPMSGAAQIALTIIMPASATLLFALLGVTLNLAFPRFDWINPIQPVKQGASAMLSMFGGMALIAVLALVYALLLSSALSLGVYLLLCTLFFLAASAGLYAHLSGAGCRKFEML